MALEELLARLEREAETRGEAILEEARAEAERIEHEAARRVARRREERLDGRESEIREELEVELAAERRRARAAMLRARDHLLERVFAAAAARLEGSEDEAARRRSLRRRLARVLAFVDGPAVVAVAPEAEAELRNALGGREDVNVALEPGLGAGFVVRSRDGRLEIDERLGARLRSARDPLAVDMMKRIGRPGGEEEVT